MTLGNWNGSGHNAKNGDVQTVWVGGWVTHRGSLFAWVGDAQTGWVAKTGSLCVWGGGGGAGHNEETGMYRLKLEAPLKGYIIYESQNGWYITCISWYTSIPCIIP